MNEDQMIALKAVMLRLLNHATEIQREAYSIFHNAGFTDIQTIQISQALLEKRESEYIREIMEEKASKIYENIKKIRPKKKGVYKSCTVNVFHEEKYIFKNYPMAKGQITLWNCVCGLHHEEWVNDTRCYKMINWYPVKENKT